MKGRKHALGGLILMGLTTGLRLPLVTPTVGKEWERGKMKASGWTDLKAKVAKKENRMP